MLGANAPRILDTTIASCKENLQSRVNKTQRVDFLELFPKIRDPLIFFFFGTLSLNFQLISLKPSLNFQFFKWNTTWPQAAATFVARLAHSQSAMTKQPSTMTALKSKTKSPAKLKIRRKLRKINLPKELRYIKANTATVVFLFFMAIN
jgi:hypothetical protein